jgi:hypothetical protein
MTPAEAWLRYHTMRRWAEKVAADGPDFGSGSFMSREKAIAAHAARMDGLNAQLRRLRDEADELLLARGVFG